MSNRVLALAEWFLAEILRQLITSVASGTSKRGRIGWAGLSGVDGRYRVTQLYG
jgi:hypothetical protein